jgi:hypothetical protein
MCAPAAAGGGVLAGAGDVTARRSCVINPHSAASVVVIFSQTLKSFAQEARHGELLKRRADAAAVTGQHRGFAQRLQAGSWCRVMHRPSGSSRHAAQTSGTQGELVEAAHPEPRRQPQQAGATH